jgi:hypothetical protein
VLLDGSVHYMRMYREVYRRNYNVAADDLSADALFESELLTAWGLRFGLNDYRKMRARLLAAADWRARRQLIVDAVMVTGVFKSEATVEWACDTLRARFLCADK